jgi:hypothetical protein
VVAEFDCLEEAQTWADADPYLISGAYANVVMDPSYVGIWYLSFSLLLLCFVVIGIWNLYLKKDIEAIENVQRRATKMLPYLKEQPYDERLKHLKLPTLIPFLML